MAAAQGTTLETGWSFKRTDEGCFLGASSSRPNRLQPLTRETYRIPDPFIDTNELDIEWICEHSWTYQTTFIRHHPSIILWAGNNEDHQIQEEYKLDYDYENKNPESWLKGSFPR
ncbi:Putative Glycoside hydrolase family 2 [Aspergillus calidoustus]|uniref:Putative Glycoside hydrolase family 2 n=1 Tax=Aspergillus calidoustus TaxID=454130 RepID=A0A0U5G2R5_ASPCI|nr:Putative Glycoside hydrolase family 2 [Aspergillus calidoustus]